jgi:hypothetical protein
MNSASVKAAEVYVKAGEIDYDPDELLLRLVHPAYQLAFAVGLLCPTPQPSTLPADRT